MRIHCPHCGWRDAADFVYGGDAAATLTERPSRRCAPPSPGEDSPLGRPDEGESWLRQLYLRRNPCGEHEELWFHEQGCGRWLLARRDTRSHRLLAVRATDADHWQSLEPEPSPTQEQEVTP